MKSWGAAAMGLPARWLPGIWVEVGRQEGRKTGTLKRSVWRQDMQLRARVMAVTAEARAGMGALGGGAEDSAVT